MCSEKNFGTEDSDQQPAIGICMHSNSKAVESMLKYLQSGFRVCLISIRWPSFLIDTTLSKLDIKQVVSSRTDLETTTLDPESLETKNLGSYKNAKLSDQATTIIFTSGSSNQPKAVLHSVDHHRISAERVVSELHLGSHDKWLLCLPIWHVSGLSIVFRCLIADAEIVIPDPSYSLYQAISTYRITHISMVSTQLLQVMETRAPSCIRAVIVGGGPIPVHALERARKNGWPIHTTYGMTETSSMVTLSDLNSTLGSMGRTLEGHELLISEDQEILVRSASVGSGYIIDEKLHTIVDEDGWFHTGDMGMIDERNELHVLGRKDNMFISGGENISPEEIEFHINNFPRVQESIVIPVPHPDFGHRPVAFVRGLLQVKALSEYLTENLPTFMIPNIYHWPEHIPASQNKPNRKTFIQEAIRIQDSDS